MGLGLGLDAGRRAIRLHEVGRLLAAVEGHARDLRRLHVLAAREQPAHRHVGVAHRLHLLDAVTLGELVEARPHLRLQASALRVAGVHIYGCRRSHLGLQVWPHTRCGLGLGLRLRSGSHSVEQRDELHGRELGDDRCEVLDVGEEHGDRRLGVGHDGAGRRVGEALGDVRRQHVVEHRLGLLPLDAQLVRVGVKVER